MVKFPNWSTRPSDVCQRLNPAAHKPQPALAKPVAPSLRAPIQLSQLLKRRLNLRGDRLTNLEEVGPEILLELREAFGHIRDVEHVWAGFRVELVPSNGRRDGRPLAASGR